MYSIFTDKSCGRMTEALFLLEQQGNIVTQIDNVRLDCQKGYHLNSFEADDGVCSERATSISGVIVEPRNHQFLNHVVLNILNELPEVRPIHIFHGEHYQLDENIKFMISNGSIVLHPLTKNNFTASTYSKLMTSLEFWLQFKTDKVLVFQTDSVVCKNENRYQLLPNVKEY